MPIYEYHCPRCDADFEMLVFSHTTVACPKCGCAKPDKKMSAFAMSGTSEKGGSLSSSGSSCSGCTSSSCGSCK